MYPHVYYFIKGNCFLKNHMTIFQMIFHDNISEFDSIKIYKACLIFIDFFKLNLRFIVNHEHERL